MVRFWIRLVHDNTTRKLTANILSITVMFFHFIYLSVFSSDIGLFLSSAFVIMLFSTKKTLQIIMTLRYSKHLQLVIAGITLICSFVPHLMSLAVSLAYVLDIALLFPAKGIEDFYEAHINERIADNDKRFVEAYFK